MGCLKFFFLKYFVPNLIFFIALTRDNMQVSLARTALPPKAFNFMSTQYFYAILKKTLAAPDLRKSGALICAAMVAIKQTFTLGQTVLNRTKNNL